MFYISFFDITEAISNHFVLQPCFYQKLYDSFEEDPGIFQFATALTSSDVGEIREFLEASVNNG